MLGAAILISGAGGRLRAGELGPFAGPELVDEASDDSASGGRIRTRGADWTIARHFGGWSAYPGNDEVVGDDELDGDDLLADDEYVYSDELASSEGYDDETEYVDQFSGSGAITYTRPFPAPAARPARSPPDRRAPRHRPLRARSRARRARRHRG